MALRIRQGLSTDRTSITPESGEFLFDTDTKSLYIGDGVTPGGLLVSSASGNITYVHTQSSSASTWNINHNLGYYPNVTIIDSSGRVVEGEIDYVDVNNIQLLFSAAFTGTAYLS